MANPPTDPFEFQRQAALTEPDVYGWRYQQPAGIENLALLKAYLISQGKWTPEMDAYLADPGLYQEYRDVRGEGELGDVLIPAQRSLDLGNLLDGYTTAFGRAQGHTKLTGVFDPQGNFIAGEAFEQPGNSLRRGDYTTIASILAAAGTAGMGGVSGLGGTLSGGALSGAPAAALGGAANGALIGGIRGGDLQSALRGAATGGALAYGGSLLADAASNYFSPSSSGFSPLEGVPSEQNPLSLDYQNQMDLGNANFAGAPAFAPPDQTIEITGQRPATGTMAASLPAVSEGLSPISGSVPQISDPTIGQMGPFPAAGAVGAGVAAGAGNPLLDPRVLGPIAAGTIGAINNPGAPPAPVGTSGNASRDAIISRLENNLFGEGAAQADFSNVPALQTSAGDPNQYFQQAADALYQRNTRYLDVEQGDRLRALEARLAEQGFVPGTPGYTQAMRVFQDTSNRAYGDARDSAVLSGVTAGQNIFANNMANANLNNAASQTAFQQAAARRNQPFNEYATLRTGQQIDNAAANQANLGAYNAQVASSNATNTAIGNVIGGLVNTYTNPLAPTPNGNRRPGG